jgi:hypothetical protein
LNLNVKLDRYEILAYGVAMVTKTAAIKPKIKKMLVWRYIQLPANEAFLFENLRHTVCKHKVYVKSHPQAPSIDYHMECRHCRKEFFVPHKNFDKYFCVKEEHPVEVDTLAPVTKVYLEENGKTAYHATRPCTTEEKISYYFKGWSMKILETE